jgi:hypothetical protein
MSLHIHYAAHVDHPISHTASIGRLSIGIGAAAVTAGVIVVMSGGTALLTFAALNTVATFGGAGMTLGSFYDSYVAPPVDTCFIQTGHETVLLGPDVKPAARADHDDCKTRGEHPNKKMFEGSRIVMLGPEIRPMSRVGDRVGEGCGGTISDGIRSLVVGGERSREGEEIDESDSTAVWALDMLFKLVGLGNTIKEGDFVGAGLDVVGMAAGGDTQAIISAGRAIKSPKSVTDVVGQVDTAVNSGPEIFDLIGGGS